MSNITDQVITQFDVVKDDLAESVTKAAANGILSHDLKKRLNNTSTLLLSKEERDEISRQEALNKWKTEHYEESREIEGYENLAVIKSIRNQIDARHATFYGTDTFPQECDANVDATIENYISKERADLKKIRDYMESSLSSYKSLFNYKASMGAILNSKNDDLEKIKNKIESYKQNLFMDNRKDGYQQKNLDFYKTIHFYMLIVYYSAFVLYLIFSDFLKEKKYKNKYILLALIGYLLLPFILKYILVYLHNTYIYVLEYNNLRDEVISYPHIINE